MQGILEKILRSSCNLCDKLMELNSIIPSLSGLEIPIVLVKKEVKMETTVELLPFYNR